MSSAASGAYSYSIRNSQNGKILLCSRRGTGAVAVTIYFFLALRTHEKFAENGASFQFNSTDSPTGMLGARRVGGWCTASEQNRMYASDVSEYFLILTVMRSAPRIHRRPITMLSHGNSAVLFRDKDPVRGPLSRRVEKIFLHTSI